MKKPNYSVLLAMSLRGKTFAEIGFSIQDNPPSVLNSVVSFIDSIKLAQDEYFAWGWDLPVWFDMGIGKDRNINREMWLKKYSSYRKFHYDCMCESQKDYKNSML